MNVFRYLVVMFTISCIMMMQACGSSSSSIGADTSGALTLSVPSKTDNGNGTFTVSTTVTYVPPAGKSAQGVVVSLLTTDDSGVPVPSAHTLTSGSNSFVYSILVYQDLVFANHVSIVAAIGSMTASVSTIIPKFTFPALAVPNPTVTFAPAALAGASVVVPFTGGTSPFTVSSSVPADITAAITTDDFPSLSGGGTLTVTLVNANVTNVVSTATVTLTDSASGSVPITVTYSK